jgi:hypothetical protein
MTKDQAIETCARAMVKRVGNPEETWAVSVKHKELAADIVAALEALGLWKPN